MTVANPHFGSAVDLAEKTAELLFEQASRRNWLREAWQMIRGGKAQSLDLLPEAELMSEQKSGRQMVSLEQIVGSSNQGRTRDFRADFRPCSSRTKARWLSIALARQQGKRLPPVQLVQRGSQFFVEDGHHRISVAAALGDQTIEAEVQIAS